MDQDHEYVIETADCSTWYVTTSSDFADLIEQIDDGDPLDFITFGTKAIRKDQILTIRERFV